MTSRPTVGIIGADGAATKNTIPLPNVFKAPIRPDIVQYATLTETLRITGMLMELQDSPHWHGQEQEAAICREREGWSPDVC